ncbi:MAG: hypothetical protein AB7P76_04750 [Candidatus Melainabacteria bacterium]
MTRRYLPLLLLTGCLLAGCESGLLRVGELPNDLLDTGCALFPRGGEATHGAIFIDTASGIWIRVNDRTIELQPAGNPPDSMRTHFDSTDYRVEVTYGEGHESDEGESFPEASLKIIPKKDPGHAVTLPAEGSCGC